MDFGDRRDLADGFDARVSGTVTLLFTDIEGSKQLLQRLGTMETASTE